uniref:ErfK/YbiS/YcfS/YnhG family protein n=1 Tax=uncultured bacterium Contig39 TaxID=1393565 RepID=W0FKJ1_9BACT|nr:ErfK/YbiS/YcfS/YnhG family protein [uncultured bacterium Contig39]
MQKRFGGEQNNLYLCLVMKKLFYLLLALLPALPLGAQGRYAQYLPQVDSAPFIVVDKQHFTLTLVDAQGEPLKQYGISCAINYGPKKVRGDHKTPEGTFKINQLLNAKGLSHDFKDGKGPVKDAYGPWFLRLDVPGFWDIGIHGTPFPESIGTRATEGCIRLRNEDILDLKAQVQVGTPVIILPDPV